MQISCLSLGVGKERRGVAVSVRVGEFVDWQDEADGELLYRAAAQSERSTSLWGNEKREEPFFENVTQRRYAQPVSSHLYLCLGRSLMSPFLSGSVVENAQQRRHVFRFRPASRTTTCISMIGTRRVSIRVTVRLRALKRTLSGTPWLSSEPIATQRA